jgi:hypothetical protein
MTDTTVSVTAPAPVKPGWQTTEWYGKLLAILLTAAYASGLIPTSGTASTIAAIAATVLGYLGYAVSRTVVKAGAK